MARGVSGVRIRKCVDGDPVDGNDTWKREARKQDSAVARKLKREVKPSFTKSLKSSYA